MIPSYHDLNNENSYHMMMLGMCLCLSDNYKVIYNREEGKGRCDFIIQAHDEKKTSFIIEFKYFKEDKKDFEKYSTIAITSGASTPTYLTNQVKDYLSNDIEKPKIRIQEIL